ncbi:beta-glucoside-specific PTS transporter subunit IIABC [uncultured Helcococcus sp.]|uniref:beta-glucoside-specific PTS transporter subunit IIABC n=1 Tax=uncultured Helcococcus sp. TaxID=1072508 RepID=UPI00260D7122|nr:beta-glucoside-specific PTS transporter subunit IIABC [uncultured Helcococcus sp.]
MGKYTNLAQDIVKNVGGKENINNVFHCITRLRFNLKDESKANDEFFKNNDEIVTLMKSGGQYQVVIGNHVPEVFEEVTKVAGISGDQPSGSSSNQNLGAKLLEYIQAIFMPYLSVLAAAGIIKGLATILSTAGWVPAESGLGVLLAAMGDTVFYFLPVFVAYTFSTKLGLNKFTGLAIGLSLLHPTITGIAEETIIFGVNVQGLAYNSTVLPIIFGILLSYPLEKFFNKILPTVVKAFLTPLLTILITVPIIYVFVGPLANNISNSLYAGLSSIYEFSPIVAGAVSAFFWQILVIFGVHQALIVPSIIGLSQGTPDLFISFIGAAPFAQMAVVIMMWLKTKNKKKKSLMLPAWISGIFGITEPAIYGFTLPNIKLFIAGCIAAAFGGAYIGATKAYTYQMAGLGIFSLPGAISAENPSNLTNFIIGNLISIVLALIFTFFLYKEDKTSINEEEASKAKEKLSNGNKESLIHPLKGQVVELDKISDQAFASGVLGKGVAIIPSANDLVSPVDGTVTTIFPTKHAIGITSNDGAEVLIHIGLNTVELAGEGFDVKVQEGDKVKAGDLLMTIDFAGIQAKGYDITTPIIVTNTDDYLDVIALTDSPEKIVELIH